MTTKLYLQMILILSAFGLACCAGIAVARLQNITNSNRFPAIHIKASDWKAVTNTGKLLVGSPVPSSDLEVLGGGDKPWLTLTRKHLPPHSANILEQAVSWDATNVVMQVTHEPKVARSNGGFWIITFEDKPSIPTANREYLFQTNDSISQRSVNMPAFTNYLTNLINPQHFTVTNYDGLDTNSIKEAIARGDVCAVVGHRWESGRLVINGDPVSRHCVLCKKVETRELGPWK